MVRQSLSRAGSLLFNRKLASRLHKEAFSANPQAREVLKQGIVDEHLRQIFADGGYALGRTPRIDATNPRRWRLVDGRTAYLIKDLGDRLVVIRETSPIVCQLIEFLMFKAKARYYRSRWRTEQMRLQCGWTLRKRLRERPPKLLVNIGAGSWYVPDWKILEYRGPWYSFYLPGFIDYHHDLTSSRPFPFANDSVHLFYCEHVIEHLKDEWCEHLFREAFRSLKPGGGFRVVMPDADLIYEALLKRDIGFFRTWMERDNSSLEEAFCTLVAQSRSFEKEKINLKLSTLSMHEFLDWCKEGLVYDWARAGEHINWFNFEKLSQMLRTVGFCNVRRSEPQQSHFEEARGPKFDTRPWYSLHVDCAKV
jgi:hypothetical protein